MGGVKGTKYPLKTRNHAPRTTPYAPRTTRHAPRTTPHGKPKTVSLHFSSKRRGTIKLVFCGVHHGEMLEFKLHEIRILSVSRYITFVLLSLVQSSSLLVCGGWFQMWCLFYYCLFHISPAFGASGRWFCLCWGFTAQSTQCGHVERGQFT